MVKNSKIAFFQVVLFVIFLSSCTKKETNEVDNETQSVVDNAIANQEFMSILSASQHHAFNTKGIGNTTNLCDTLTKISGDTLWASATHTIPTYSLVIPNSSCSRSFTDSKTRTGSLLIRASNKIGVAGTKMTIKLVNYKAADITYTCDSIEVTTVSSNSLFTEFNVKLIKGLVGSTNGNINYSFDKTIRHYFSGNPIGTESFISVFGNATGVNSQGRVFTSNTPSASPLIKRKNCQYIDKGVLSLTPEGFKTRSVDFGDGTCDETATFLVNNNTISFKLK